MKRITTITEFVENSIVMHRRTINHRLEKYLLRILSIRTFDYSTTITIIFKLEYYSGGNTPYAKGAIVRKNITNSLLSDHYGIYYYNLEDSDLIIV